MLGIGKKKGRVANRMTLSGQESPSLAHRKQRLQRLFILAAFAVLVAAVTEFRTFRDPTGRYDIDEGGVASREIRAALAFDTEDLQATNDQREQAAALVPATFNVDRERVKQQQLTIQARMTTLKDRGKPVDEAIRTALLASNSLKTKKEVVDETVAELAAEWQEDPLFEGFPKGEHLAVWLMPRLESVPNREFNPVIPTAPDGEPPAMRGVFALIEPEEAQFEFANAEILSTLALESLDYVLTAGVLQPESVVTQEGGQAPRIQIVRGRVVGDLPVAQENDLAEIPGPKEARTLLRDRIAEMERVLEEARPDAAVDWTQVQAAAFEMASSGVTDTLFLNRVGTEANRQLARADVEPVMMTIKANQIIQHDGEAWTLQSISDVNTYWDLLEGGSQPVRRIFYPIVANMILVALVLAALLRSMTVLRSKNTDPYKNVNVMLVILCVTLIVGRVVSYFDSAGLAVPLMASAILLAILTNARIAAMVSILAAALISIQFGHNWQTFVVICAMGVGGISNLHVVRRRSDVTRAALAGTAAGLLTLFAVTLATASIASWQTLNWLAIIALNGVACLFLVPGLLSPLERMFGITTDIQLLEYSDLNNEILSRLAIEVPATYAHSLMLGQLAETAADAIGANGLLARVCAYYHDIGKLRRPEYFSENQTGQNIHDDLSPRLSSRAIASHVAEGVEFAREFHLPQPIIDGILEHHGTLLISFFYQQALDKQKHGDVLEEDYRYSGPKPQRPENAILMICDAVESGVRSIKNPNEERVGEFIDKIIQSRSRDRQFDECDLTLKDLDIIGKILTKHVITTLHTRIAYPEKKSEGIADNVIPLSGRRD